MASAISLLVRGNRCLEAELYPEARLFYWWAHDLAPVQPEPFFNLMIHAIRADKLEEARNTLASLLSMSPELGARLGLTDAETAFAELERRMFGDPDLWRVAPLGSGDVSEEFAAEPRVTYASLLSFATLGDEASAALDRGLACLQANDPLGAIVAYWDVIQRDPAESVAYANMSAACNMIGHYEEAIAVARKAIALDAGNFNPHFNLGTALRQTGQFVAALEAFEGAMMFAGGDESMVEAEVETTRAASARSDEGLWPDALSARKADADFHLLSLITGFLPLGRVADWIDQELGIPEGREPLLDELGAGGSEAALNDRAARLLRAVPGHSDLERPTRVLLGLLGKKLAHEPDELRHHAMRITLRVQNLTGAPPADDPMFWRLRNRYGPAGAGFPGEALADFLGTYAEDADRFIRSGSIPLSD